MNAIADVTCLVLKPGGYRRKGQRMSSISHSLQTHKSCSSSIGLSYLAIQIIVLVEGFVTVALEILTIRQVVPVVGSNVIVTSLVIGIFLLFLAYGYRQGGKVQDQYINVLVRNFTISAILIGIGISYLFVEQFFGLLVKLVGNHQLIILTIYLLAITAPLVYMLGQTVPITMHLQKNHSTRINEIGGNVLHISTIGSFFGAVLTSIILMRFFGLGMTVFMLFALLVIMVFYLNLVIEFRWGYVLTLVVFSVPIYFLNVSMEKLLFITSNAFANYYVDEIDTPKKGKILVLNQSNASFIGENNEAYPYAEKIKDILFKDLALTNKDILVLGAGGFTISAQNTFGNQFTYVEIDPELPKIVREHFLKDIKGNIVIQDARQYLIFNKQKHDVIITDAYTNRTVLPSHLVTAEFFSLIKERLNNNGLAVFNIIGNPLFNDKFTKRVDNTVRSVFDSCAVIPLRFNKQKVNMIYICQNRDLSDKSIYTDNINRVDFDL